MGWGTRWARALVGALTALAVLAGGLVVATRANAAPGSSLRFSGTTGVVTVADRAALRLTTNLTLEARAKPLLADRPMAVAGKSYYEISMYPVAGGVQFTMEVRIGTAWREARSTTYPLNQWYALAGTYDGAHLRLFVNGELVGDSAVTGAVATSTSPFRIGSVEGSGDVFNGNVDEVRLSSSVRYTGTYAVPASPFTTDATTVGLWHLDEGSGTTAADASGGGGTGTVGANVTWSLDNPFGGGDTTPPVISAVGAADVTGSTTTIGWTTNEVASSQVDYGTTTAYGSSTPLDLAPITSHAVGLANLTVSTTYHFRVRSRDGAGNEAVSPDATFTTGATDPRAASGTWDPLQTWPLVGVHLVQLYTGEFLVYDAWEIPARPRVWNPATNVFTNVDVPAGIFCSGHSVLPDGRVVIVGGHAGGEIGIADAFLFDPATRAFTRLPNMAQARWYPSATTLGDGRVVVLSGNITPSTWADTPEVFDPTTNKFSSLTGVSTADLHEEEYPLSFLLPDGKVFTIISTTGVAKLLDVNARTWTPLANTQVFNGAAVQYRPGKILTTGGGNVASSGPSLTRAEVIDTTAATPQWRQVPSMHQARYMHNLTMLADGMVFAVGGSSTADQLATVGALVPEIWDPATEGWSEVAPMANPRMYHSTSVLLPDGRVLTAGGGRLGTATDYLSAQVYNPPYLFKGNRPTITSAPAQSAYGATMAVASPDAANITSVNLVRLASVTHTLDQDQHFVPLTFTVSGGTVNVNAPTSTGVAPPGYYMLFLVNASGVPSVAATVKLTGTGGPADTQPPTASVSAPVAGATVSGTVTLGATATDNVGVTGVQFKVDGANVGPLDTTAPYSTPWDSTAATNSGHTVTAVATDAAGNVTTSAPVTVTVNNNVVDTRPPVISAVAAATVVRTGASISWTTDEASTSQADYGTTTAYGSTTAPDPARVTSHRVDLTGLAPDTTYNVRVRSADAAGNEAVSANITFRTVGSIFCSMVAPASGATVSGTVALQAQPGNTIGTATVQFTVDGTDVGSPVTAAPYAASWNSSAAAAGPHALGARVLDASGATATASPVTVTVNNSRPAPVAAYNFNETAGTTAADATGNGNTGTVTAGTWSAGGRNGGAISLAGTGWVTVNDSPRLRGGSALTVEAWVRPNASQAATWRTVLMKERTGGMAYTLYANGSTATPSGYVNLGGTDLPANGTAALVLNTWTHLAMTYDGTTERFYLNGALVASTPAAGSIVASTGALRIGGNSIWTERFRGLIDDVRIYDTVLTPAQIQADLATPV